MASDNVDYQNAPWNGTSELSEHSYLVTFDFILERSRNSSDCLEDLNLDPN